MAISAFMSANAQDLTPTVSAPLVLTRDLSSVNSHERRFIKLQVITCNSVILSCARALCWEVALAFLGLRCMLKHVQAAKEAFAPGEEHQLSNMFSPMSSVLRQPATPLLFRRWRVYTLSGGYDAAALACQGTAGLRPLLSDVERGGMLLGCMECTCVDV